MKNPIMNTLRQWLNPFVIRCYAAARSLPVGGQPRRRRRPTRRPTLGRITEERVINPGHREAAMPFSYVIPDPEMDATPMPGTPGISV